MRYLVLVVLNIPVILLALVSIIMQYKLGKASKQRFHHQLILWLVLLTVLIGSFPVYNHLSGRQAFDSSDLSVFDIMQTTAIVALIYVTNTQRQRIEATERRFNDLHQELSIILSTSQKSE